MKTKFDSVVIDLKTGQLANGLEIHLQERPHQKVDNNKVVDNIQPEQIKKTEKPLENISNAPQEVKKVVQNKEVQSQPEQISDSPVSSQDVSEEPAKYARGAGHSEIVRNTNTESTKIEDIINSENFDNYNKPTQVQILTSKKGLKFYFRGKEFKDFITNDEGYLLNLKPTPSSQISIVFNKKIKIFNLDSTIIY